MFAFANILLFSVYAQTSANLPVVVVSESKKWNLNNIVWSHGRRETSNTNKGLIDFDAIDNWTTLTSEEDLSVSPNGKYFAYGIQKGFGTLGNRMDSLVIQSVDNSFRKSFSASESGIFTKDSKQYIFWTSHGLCLFQTTDGQFKYLNDAISYKLSPDSEKEWLGYHLKNKDLVLKNTLTGQGTTFKNISSFVFDKSAKWLICELDDVSKDLLFYNIKMEKEQKFQNYKSYLVSENGNTLVLNTEFQISYVDLISGRSKIIWKGKDKNETIEGVSVDSSGKQVAIIIRSYTSKENQTFLSSENTVWYWKEGMNNAEVKVTNESKGLEGGMKIQGKSFTFVNKGKYFQFTLQAVSVERNKSEMPILIDVWNYKDNILQSNQLKRTARYGYQAILNLQTGKIFQLENEFESVKGVKGDYALVVKSNRDKLGDRYWEYDYYSDTTFLVSLIDNSRKFISTNADVSFSPTGNWLLFYDSQKQGSYLSYNVLTSQLVNISKGLSFKNFGTAKSMHRIEGEDRVNYAFRGWLINGLSVLVYDSWDIWQLDLTGKKSAENITNGYGNKNQIVFSLLNYNRDERLSDAFLYVGNKLILRAYNVETKYNGFFNKDLEGKADPEQLYMDRCMLSLPKEVTRYSGMLPVNVGKGNKWIVKRETATDGSNYFLTDSFKQYQRLTNLQPHKKYNWGITELHNFKGLDGIDLQGVLYKPDNFDPGRKYPVIVSFYGRESDGIYRYLKAGYIDRGSIFEDPSWIASHGYLVFVPDIYFNKQGWGPNTVNSVDAAAKYLSQLSYVDAKHIGAAGHSNSGRFGNYLLTHSHSFAAIATAVGTSNVISASLNSDRLQWGEELAPGGGLGTFWENKEKWLDHAASLNADKVSTPFLLLYPANDGAFEPGQAFELFQSLRRIEKKSWWLQYDKSAHTLSRKDAPDFTIRYTQFFDHYLKCAPAPRWMTQGIPNKLKGIEARYELDAVGNCALEKARDNCEFAAVWDELKNGKLNASQVPAFDRNKKSAQPWGCNICNAWNAQYKRTPEMFSKEIKYWELDNDIKEALDKAETARHKSNMVGEAQRIKENNEKLKGTWKGKPY